MIHLEINPESNPESNPEINPEKMKSKSKSVKSKSKSKTVKSKSKTKTIKSVKIPTRITKFFNKPETVRQANFLKGVCSDSGQCVTFGLESERVYKFFDNFELSPLVIDIKKIKRLGAPSVNGFVTEIPYKKEKYNAYAVLKSAIEKDSDNLYYEALVGLYLNKKGLIFPCFLQTYDVFYYNNTHTYNSFRDNKVTDSTLLNNVTKLHNDFNYRNMFLKDTINRSCVDSKYMCVLIQHLKNAETLADLLEKYKKNEDFFTVFLVNILFQVYCPLSFLSDEFTHYDLHDSNVLIYEPSAMKKKHVTMIYHYPDNSTVQFNTYGIAKIIDYGRCYFNDKTEGFNSQSFHKNLCNSKKCDNCGDDNGYTILQKEVFPGSFYHISSQKRNKSHDLRLASKIFNIPGKFSGESSMSLRELLSNVTYEDDFGTPEVLGDSYIENKKIQNVHDMHLALKDLMNQNYFKEKNEIIFQGSTLMGQLHVWVDGSKSTQYLVNNE